MDMAKTNKIEVMRFPGEFYADQCLNCYELIGENYGATWFDKCSYCQFTDSYDCDFLVVKSEKYESRIKIPRD